MTKYVVTVKFIIKKDKSPKFIKEVIKNSRKSLLESGCERFDISEKENMIFLYEVYNTEDDFRNHIKTDHYNEFDKLTAQYVLSKSVEIYDGVEIL